MAGMRFPPHYLWLSVSYYPRDKSPWTRTYGATLAECRLLAPSFLASYLPTLRVCFISLLRALSLLPLPALYRLPFSTLSSFFYTIVSTSTLSPCFLPSPFFQLPRPLPSFSNHVESDELIPGRLVPYCLVRIFFRFHRSATDLATLYTAPVLFLLKPSLLIFRKLCL